MIPPLATPAPDTSAVKQTALEMTQLLRRKLDEVDTHIAAGMFLTAADALEVICPPTMHAAEALRMIGVGFAAAQVGA